MKRILILLMVISGFATTHAEDYTYLTIVELNGARTSLTAVGLSMSFTDGNLSASNAYTGESKVVALTDLASMNFSNDDETTGIRNIKADDNVGIEDGVYTLQGQKMPAGIQLPKGIYIIRKNNVAQKRQVR